jgi:iron complex transport system ATP-binding protein
MDKVVTNWAFDKVSVGLGGAKVVSDATFGVTNGELVAVLGANGAGKSSLIKAGLGLLACDSGAVLLDGQNPAKLPTGVRARQVAYLPQSRPLAWPLSVRDVVALGRFAFGAAPGRLGKADADAVEAAIGACNIVHLADRATDTLSGGELARVHVARALAAQAPLLVADEPTAALDPAQALGVTQVVADFCAKGGAALVILHDISLAARFASRIIVMSQGAILVDAPPTQALTPDILRRAFGIDARLAEIDGTPALSIAGISA